MLARRLPSILPPLTRGGGARGHAHPQRRGPARTAPGSSTRGRSARRTTPSAPPGSSAAAPSPSPGEVSLAHHGVLFLDELTEFPRPRSRRCASRSRTAGSAIVRGQRSAVFPTRFMLVAATNPCPCGFARGRRCRCTRGRARPPPARLSGPLLDRIDLLVARRSGPTARELARRAVTLLGARARARASRRASGRLRRLRGHRRDVQRASWTRAVLRELVGSRPTPSGCCAAAYERGALSARGRDRVLRVARTVADLDGRDAGRAASTCHGAGSARTPTGRRRHDARAGVAARPVRRRDRLRRVPAAHVAGRPAGRVHRARSTRAAGAAAAPAGVLALSDAALVAALAGERRGRSRTRSRASSRGGCGRRERGGLGVVCRHDDAYPRAPARPRRRAGGPARRRGAGRLAGLSAARRRRRRGRGGRRHAARLAGRPRGRALARAWAGRRRRHGRQRHGARRRQRRPRGRARGGRADRRGARRRRGPRLPAPASARCTAGSAARRCVLSELPPGFAPHRWCFPARNRIIAALAAATVVVEAAERSGSLITAELAADLGREVGAVPGSPLAWRSAGTNALLRDGATLVRDARDALDVVLGVTGGSRPDGGAACRRPARGLRAASIRPCGRCSRRSCAGRDTSPRSHRRRRERPGAGRAQRARAARALRRVAGGRYVVPPGGRSWLACWTMARAQTDARCSDEQARYYAASRRRVRRLVAPPAAATTAARRRRRAGAPRPREVEAALAASARAATCSSWPAAPALWTEHLARHADRVRCRRRGARRSSRSPSPAAGPDRRRRAAVRPARGRPLRAGRLPRRYDVAVVAAHWLSHVPSRALRGVLAPRGRRARPPVAGRSSSTAAARPARRRATTCSPDRGRTRWSAACDDGRAFRIVKRSGSRTSWPRSWSALGWRTDLTATREFFVFGSAARADGPQDGGETRRSGPARSLRTVPGPAPATTRSRRCRSACRSPARTPAAAPASRPTSRRSRRAGVHGTTAITAITAQNTVGRRRPSRPVSPGDHRRAGARGREDLGVDAVKIGHARIGGDDAGGRRRRSTCCRRARRSSWTR